MGDTLQKESKPRFDEYVHSTLSSFCQHKKYIVLDLDELYDGDGTMRDLIMNKMEKRYAQKEIVRKSGDLTNLFRSEIFGIFSNLQTVSIISTFSSCSYSLSMTELLSSIESLPLNEVIVKAKGKNNWIASLWESPEIIQKEYAGKGYTISMQKKGGFERWFTIN